MINLRAGPDRCSPHQPSSYPRWRGGGSFGNFLCSLQSRPKPSGGTEQPSLHHVEVDMPIVVRMKVILSLIGPHWVVRF